MPSPIGQEFELVQNEYLQEENRSRGIVTLDEIKPICSDLYLWRGDITTLRCGAIVNAANSAMTGCYHPCHNCIDNCIHTYSGVQLRNYCNELMEKQGHPEPTGTAKLTPSFNLPCDYVIHTVGPIVQGRLTEKHKKQLTSCYLSCLELAEKNKVESIAFCCISTGVFMFPNDEAAKIAVQTVKKYKAESGSEIKVIFNVFKEQDEQLYRELLG
jgi:O-acetyl-ADP-ribose deacetylase (regulator of RNase III)